MSCGANVEKNKIGKLCNIQYESEEICTARVCHLCGDSANPQELVKFSVVHPEFGYRNKVSVTCEERRQHLSGPID